jgi:sugar-specific transcriptional regulator TrmB
MINLSAAGLTTIESDCYTALLSKADWKPAELAKSVSMTRTNCYKILDNLVALKLAARFDKDKKLHYRATNPSRLLELAREQRMARDQAEADLQQATQSLTHNYYQTLEQPAVRYFQGQAEIAQIFQEIAGAHDEVVFVHTLAGVDYYGFDTMHKLRMLAPDNNVTRRALTPDTLLATKNYRETDSQVLLDRTWLQAEDYTAPVEWGNFDDKLYIISYGKEAMGLIIDSQQIADSFRQLFALLERGQQLLPNYASLPKLASRKARVTS